MERLRFMVVRPRSAGSESGFHVYGNGGAGEIGWVHPLTLRRILFAPDVPPAAPHLLAEHLGAMHLDTFVSDGHLHGTHLLDGHLIPMASMTYLTPPLVFGRFRHAVVIEDEVGNADPESAVMDESVVNSAPPPPSGLRAVGHDVMSDRMTFSFEASLKLVG